ncbi:MAG: halocarboxylic acid dehydrogenase DehI family protein [Rubrobacteraceae bacterium]
MWVDRTEEVHRGLRLIPQLGEVMPEEANGEVRRIYEDMRARLRVPFVNFVFRMLANYPAYLSLSWNHLSPHLLTTSFERASDDLRSRALLEPLPVASVAPGLSSLGDLEDIRGFTDTIHYVLPKLLLVASALDEGLGGERGASVDTPEDAVSPGVAEGTSVLPMVAPDEAEGEVRSIFEEIQELHGHPNAASYYRGIATRPDFLSEAWRHTRPLVGSASYRKKKQELLENARDIVLGLPLPEREAALSAGVKEESLEEIGSILAVFRFRVIPDTFIEVVRIKALLDGPEDAGSSRFSFATR